MAYATASVREPDAFKGAAGASNKPHLVPLAHSVPDAARLLGVGVSKVWEMVRTGEIRSVRLGRRTVITQRELERVLGTCA